MGNASGPHPSWNARRVSHSVVDCRSYDAPACNGMAGTALGHLGPLPVENMTYIFEDITLDDALALGMPMVSIPGHHEQR